jgi:DNA polymerase III epsilon subunit family exonuclease
MSGAERRIHVADRGAVTTLVPTAAQRAAIEAPSGPVLVLAGPGAGKTFCLIERGGHQVAHHDVAAERICTVTFTNKAAEEIATRLADTLGPAAEQVTRGTLHALCAEVLRAHGEAIGIARGFGIADEVYQRLVLRRLNVPQRRIGQLLTLFSRRRLQGYSLTPGDEQLLRQYGDRLRQRHVLDFDDLILETARLFEARPEIAAAVAGRWDCVLVDEFQDLDPVQYRLLRALAPHDNVFAVGDDEQSIFSWRGADPRVLKRFADDLGITRPIVLDRNRRCSRQIFTRARRLIQVERGLFDKQLEAERTSEHDVAAFAFPDDAAEAAWLIADLQADRARYGLDWGDYAVLYRRHDVGAALESGFLRAGVPCRLARGRALVDDEVVGFVVAALRVMRHAGDPLLLEAFAQAVLPGPLLEQIRRGTRNGEIGFLDAARAFARTGPSSAPDVKRAWRFIYHVENLAATYRLRDSLAGLLDDLLAQRVGPYTNSLEDRHDELSDPAEDPAAVSLAAALEPALHGRGRAVVADPGPDRIALRGMLLAAGITIARYAAEGPAQRDEVRVAADPLRLFKALQLVHSRRLAPELTDYVAFDLETTDTDVNACEIVEIGAVRVRAGAIVERFHRLVRPRVAIAERARAVHGYDAESLVGAPRFEDVWPAFRTFVGDAVLVAHNGFAFDVPVLRRMAEPLGGTGGLVWFDSLLLARALFPAGARLQDLAHRFGVAGGRAHHALDDAATLAAVFTELGRLQVVRARKAALVNLLDYVGLGLALAPGQAGAEADLLRELSRVYALGRYSDCLAFYESERNRLGDPALPSLDEVIDRLGGRRLYERLRVERSAEERYPEAYARLRRLVEACGAPMLDESVDRLLERVALSTSEGVEVDHHRVNLLTLHSTKGLEFSRVYIVGVEDYQLPGYYQTVDNRTDEIDEARRLLYVGMTRARDRLVLTRAERRGGKSSGGNRFLDEMGLEPIAAT